MTDWFAPTPTPRLLPTRDSDTVTAIVDYVGADGEAYRVGVKLIAGYTNVSSIPNIIKVTDGAAPRAITSIKFN